MMKLQAGEIAQIVGGELFGDDNAPRKVVTGLTWDSRNIEAGNLFVAMPGEHVDGNDFIARAAQAGAGAALCTRTPTDSLKAIAGEFNCPLIEVEDGVEALGKLASAWRDRLHAVVIGITGSTGKTSTKDFTRAVLGQKFKTCATVGNHNNEIGVPATVLEADEDTEVLIVELGMRGLGQIEHLCHIVKPTIGIITNIGVSHMELLGSRDNIAIAKAELLDALPGTGLAILNADDEYFSYLVSHAQLEERGIACRSYGFAEGAFAQARDVRFDIEACADFTLVINDEEVPVHVPLPGRHNVSNALAAAVAGTYLGMRVEEVAEGIARATGSGMRLEIEHARNGVTVLNDAYNANPDSMKASLETLKTMDCTGKRIAVLGDMGELGADEYQLHVEVGKVAANARLDLLVCVGSLANGIAQGALDARMDAGKVVSFEDVSSAEDYLRGVLDAGDLVLVKASRFMGMERIVRGIVA